MMRNTVLQGNDQAAKNASLSLQPTQQTKHYLVLAQGYGYSLPITHFDLAGMTWMFCLYHCWALLKIFSA
ncbi:hypothetical protein [Acinetobacter bereziniae]|uniref:hypothetical protein n=1 Tax=Acinetobacter bereziniae TaxID=106648 RepID=UPI0021E44241|nr:hypothetical protein [Acinetobacter bereziniae]MCV2443624.1 hypothetical protein [Acinetobacter bereziniae]